MTDEDLLPPGIDPKTRKLAVRLFQPVDAAGLAYFRIAFFAVLVWEVFRMFDNNWIGKYYSGKGADAAVQQIAKGDEGPALQEAMVAVEKADVAFKLMMEVRQKILDAYQDIMRMQV